MAKHPVPKRHQSKTRTAKRYSKFAAETTKRIKNSINLKDCPKCGQKILMHHVCKNCGMYRSRQILKVKNADKKTVTKVRA